MDKYLVPKEIMNKTKEFLIAQGKLDREAYVLWKGVQKPKMVYSVTGLIIPEQTAIKTPLGYAFDISPQSIAGVTAILRQSNEIGLIQVHSHPGISTRHSKRDDLLGLLGRKGALSIVLPHFGNIRFLDFTETTVHVLTGINKWDPVPKDQVAKILRCE